MLFTCCSCSVAKSCLILCDPMECITPGLLVLHYLPEFVQIHVHWFGDAIQPSHSQLPPFPPAFSLSKYRTWEIISFISQPWWIFEQHLEKIIIIVNSARGGVTGALLLSHPGEQASCSLTGLPAVVSGHSRLALANRTFYNEENILLSAVQYGSH